MSFFGLLKNSLGYGLLGYQDHLTQIFKKVNLIKILIISEVNLSTLAQIMASIFSNQSFYCFLRFLFLDCQYSFSLLNFCLIEIIQKLARFENQKLDRRISRFYLTFTIFNLCFIVGMIFGQITLIKTFDYLLMLH